MREGAPAGPARLLNMIGGSDWTPLGYSAGPDYAFLAAGKGQRRRSVALLAFGTAEAIVAFELGADRGAPWPLLAGCKAVPTPARIPVYVGKLPQGSDARAAVSLELAGVRVRDRAVLFHAEPAMARSAVSFEVDGAGILKVLITGVAPGDWDVWHNGFLVRPQLGVEPKSGALYWEGEPGSYFLRPLT